MTTVSLAEAQLHLAELIAKVVAGEDILITQDQKPVARLTPVTEQKKLPRRPGSLRGTVLYMAPDFNAPLEEFKEYMP